MLCDFLLALLQQFRGGSLGAADRGILDIVATVLIPASLLRCIPELGPQAFSTVIQPLVQQ